MITKGEWKAVLDDGAWIVVADEGNEVCDCDFASNQGECEANAQLIASAPDLYEACKLALKLADAIVKQVSRDNVEVLMARATISQALAKQGKEMRNQDINKRLVKVRSRGKLRLFAKFAWRRIK